MTSVESEYQPILDRMQYAIDVFNEYFAPDFEDAKSITASFELDGSPVISRDEFVVLPDWMKNFYLDDRIMPVAGSHVFQAGQMGDSSTIYAQSGINQVALRGPRYYDQDGKYEWGPNELEALNLLISNITRDREILDNLLEFQPKSYTEWLSGYGIWNYLTNDVSSAYYLFRCANAIGQDNKTFQDIKSVEMTLDLVSFAMHDYFLSLTGNVDKTDIKDGLSEISRRLPGYAEVIRDNSHLDLIRSHREAANPLSLASALHIAFETDYLNNSDLVLAPLYGGVDIGEAIKYVLYRREIFERVLNRPITANRELQVFHALTRMVKRRPPRKSEIASVVSHINAQTVPAQYDRQLWPSLIQAKQILVVDDSVGRFETIKEIKQWLPPDIDGNQLEVGYAVVMAAVRWAEGNSILLSDFYDTQAICVLPLTRSFLGRWSQVRMAGSYLPEWKIIRGSLLRDRTFMTPEMLTGHLLENIGKGVYDGVGFDLYETLVDRPQMTRDLRRVKIYDAHMGVIAKYGLKCEPEVYRNILRSEIKKAKSIAGETGEYSYRGVLKAVIMKLFPDLANTGQIVSDLLQNEFGVELAFTEVRPGIWELLDELDKNKVPVGIYSNTVYPKPLIMELLVKLDLRVFQSGNVLTSSETGIKKPSPDSIKLLASALGVPVQQMAFVGNNQVDWIGAYRSKAVAIRLLYPGEYPKEERLLKEWEDFLHAARRT